MTVPTYLYNEKRADKAFARWKDVRQSEARDPALLENPTWAAFREDTYRRFEREFIKRGPSE